MALELVLTLNQEDVINQLNKYGKVHCTHMMSHALWNELVSAGYCWRLGEWYFAHENYETPGFQMSEPDARGSTSEAADWLFEETQTQRFEDGRLQI